MNFLLLSSILFLTSCLESAFRPQKILSSPEWRTTPYRKDHKVLLIASTNDFLGQTREEKKKGSHIQVGGKRVFSNYLTILKKREKELLLLDSGDLFLDDESFKDTLDLYQKAQFDGVGLSLQDFLFLKRKNYSASDISFISSNLIELETQKPPFGIPEYRIVEKNSLKIAIFSLVSFIPHNMSEIQRENKLYFSDPVANFLKFRHQLETRDKVQIFIALVNFPNSCHSENLFTEKKSKEKNQLQCSEKENHLLSFARRLPKQKIDLIIASGDRFAEGFIEDIPILQNPGMGQFLSRARIVYDIKKSKIISEETKIFPPVETCHYFFVETQDCQPLPESKKEFYLVPAKFLGYSVLTL